MTDTATLERTLSILTHQVHALRQRTEHAEAELASIERLLALLPAGTLVAYGSMLAEFETRLNALEGDRG